MKSFLYVAPAFPPPPYTSLTTTRGAEAVVKLQLGLPSTVSGGSFVSWSEIREPSSVTVQVSLNAKSASGLSRNDVPSPVATAVWDPLVPQEIANHEPVTFTGSVKVMP